MIPLLAAALTCVIVVPTDQAPGNFSPRIVMMHELAHCNGWSHDDSPNAVNDMRNVIPPPAFRHKPSMPVRVIRAPTAQTWKICTAAGGPSYGCQWFE